MHRSTTASKVGGGLTALIVVAANVVWQGQAFGANAISEMKPYLCTQAPMAAPEQVLPWGFASAVDILNAHPEMRDRPIKINPDPAHESSTFMSLFVLCMGVRPPIRLRRYVENCAYLGDQQTIVCDAEILHAMLRDVSYTTDEDARKQILSLSAWILAHEVGHLVASDGETWFGVGGRHATISAEAALQTPEVAADQFAAQLLSRTEVWDHLIGFLGYNLMYKELKKLVPDRAFAAGVGMPLLAQDVKILSCGSHPHYVFRALSMLAIDGRNEVTESIENLKASLSHSDCNP